MRKEGIVVVMVCLAVLAGQAVFATGASEAAPAAKGAVLSPVGTYPLVKEKVNITVMAPQGVYIEDFNTNEFTKFMEEKTNVHIVWETISEQSAADKISLILASNDLPEVFFGCPITSDQEVQYGSDEKLLVPLEKYIDASMPELQKAFEDFPGSRGICTSPDGHIYGLPLLTDCYHCIYSGKAWIYQPWLDSLGLKAPTTTEELYQVLKVFKDKDPNGNGKKDELPMAGAATGWHNPVDEYIIDAFIWSDLDSNVNANASSRMGWFLNNGKVDTAINKPDYREGLRFLNKLYKEGLIYEGSFTQEAKQLTQLVENPEAPIVGVTAGGWGGQFSSFGGARYRDFRALTPLKGPKGYQSTFTQPTSPTTGRFVVTKVCKNPEVAVRWADYLYTTEGTLRLRRGTPGKSWRWAEKGEIGINGKPAIWTQIKPWSDKDPQNDSWVSVGVFNESSDQRLGQSMDPNVDLYSAEGLEKLLYEVSKNQYAPYGKSDLVLPPLKFLKDEQTALVTVRSELAKYIKQSLVKFIVGNMDLDKDWDKYLADLDRMGMKTILQSNQKAYDRQYVKK